MKKEMIVDNKEYQKVKIGDYELVGQIGQGGAAEIFKARQKSLERDVAIKILSKDLSDNPDIVHRFEQESLVIARLNHPNIVHIIDKGFVGGRYYFVMTYVDGPSLRQVIDSDSIKLGNKLEMVVQICKGLDYAHKNGVIHRDIKPANVLIDRQGNALVADFGIAQIIGQSEVEKTSNNIVMGTYSYMSPEQKVSSSQVDQTTDIFSVGVILYEILCGRKPQERYRLPSIVNPKVSQAFDKIISKCLAPDPSDRYQRAVELKDDILFILKNGSVKERPLHIDDTSAVNFLGKCQYLDTIKETSYSSTILVESNKNNKLYVIKKFNRGDSGLKGSQILSKLKHKNILNIYGAGKTNKETFVITEYAQNGSLSDRLARAFDWEQGMLLMLDLLAGLNHAHNNNIIHGNIRPSNILFDKEDNPKLSDFGLPAHYEETKEKNWYSPPEYKKSFVGDIYGLGVIFHQILTAHLPVFENNGELNLDLLKESVPESVIKILSKMLSVRIDRRYQKVDDIYVDWSNIKMNKLKSGDWVNYSLGNDHKAEPKPMMVSEATPTIKSDTTAEPESIAEFTGFKPNKKNSFTSYLIVILLGLLSMVATLYITNKLNF